MANATVSLNSTTLDAAVSQKDGATQNAVTLASTTNVLPGLYLFIDRELMKVVSLGLGTSVNVLRGQGGTFTSGHAFGSTVYIGRGDQFYQTDPRGLPPNEVLVYPYININTGDLWVAQGDESGSGLQVRQWSKITTTQEIGPLGVRVKTTQIPA